MNRNQKNDKVWAKVGADRREIEALRTAAKNFLAGNTTAEAVAEFKSALGGWLVVPTHPTEAK